MAGSLQVSCVCVDQLSEFSPLQTLSVRSTWFGTALAKLNVWVRNKIRGLTQSLRLQRVSCEQPGGQLSDMLVMFDMKQTQTRLTQCCRPTTELLNAITSIIALLYCTSYTSLHCIVIFTLVTSGSICGRQCVRPKRLYSNQSHIRSSVIKACHWLTEGEMHHKFWKINISYLDIPVMIKKRLLLCIELYCVCSLC